MTRGLGAPGARRAQSPSVSPACAGSPRCSCLTPLGADRAQPWGSGAPVRGRPERVASSRLPRLVSLKWTVSGLLLTNVCRCCL